MIKILESVANDIEYFSNGSELDSEDIKDSIRYTINHSMFRKVFSVWDLDRKIVICFFGLNYISNGIYEVWLAKSKNIYEYTSSLWSKVKYFFELMLEEKFLHRYQATVCVDNIKYIKFLSFLGMRCEGLLKNYKNDGKDFYLLARGI